MAVMVASVESVRRIEWSPCEGSGLEPEPEPEAESDDGSLDDGSPSGEGTLSEDGPLSDDGSLNDESPLDAGSLLDGGLSLDDGSEGSDGSCGADVWPTVAGSAPIMLAMMPPTFCVGVGLEGEPGPPLLPSSPPPLLPSLLLPPSLLSLFPPLLPSLGSDESSPPASPDGSEVLG